MKVIVKTAWQRLAMESMRLIDGIQWSILFMTAVISFKNIIMKSLKYLKTSGVISLRQ